MTGHEFERKIRGLGRNRGAAVSFDRGPGKGSHGRLYYGAGSRRWRTAKKGNRPQPVQRDAATARADEERPGGL